MEPSPEIPRADRGPQSNSLPDLVPARMLNEFAYCPRLAYLEWVQGEFAESADTLDGTFQHRRVDRPGGRLPPPPGAGGEGASGSGGCPRAETEDEREVIHSRSVHLSGPGVGLVAVIDLIEAAAAAPGTPSQQPPAQPPAEAAGGKGEGAAGGRSRGKKGVQAGKPAPQLVTPVDYKRGRVPDIPERAWEPERVQLCAQGLILRENGYRCDGGVLYFVQSRTRVPVAFDDALVARTLELLGQMRAMAAGGRIPPPLVDSPKCPRCSLVGICLPDETRLLAGGAIGAAPGEARVELSVSARAASADRSLTAAGGTRRDGAADDDDDDGEHGAGADVTSDAGDADDRRDDRGDDAADDEASDGAEGSARPRVRRLIPRGDDGRPLYVTESRAWVGKSGDTVQVKAPADAAEAMARLNGNGNGSGKVAGFRRAKRSSGSDGQERVVLAEVRLAELTHVCLFGTAQVSTQLVHELCDRQIPVAYFSHGGYFRGITTGLPSKNVELRIAQYRLAADPAFCVGLSRAITAGKIENQRTLLRRNHEGGAPAVVLEDLRLAVLQAERAPSLETLLGVEGNAAKGYFGGFQGMLRPRDYGAAGREDGVGTRTSDAEEAEPVGSAPRAVVDGSARDGPVRDADPTGDDSMNEAERRPARAGRTTPQFRFDFNGRNRRPPMDPVNALLSLGYAVLAKDLTAACWVVGLDPFLGFYHQPRYGRPALALDLMEEFRPLVVDSTVLTAINTGVVSPDDFVLRGPAVALRPDGRRRFLQAYERRMETLVTHGVFGYRVSYRRLLEVQARLLSRVLLGELPGYVPFTTR